MAVGKVIVPARIDSTLVTLGRQNISLHWTYAPVTFRATSVSPGQPLWSSAMWCLIDTGAPLSFVPYWAHSAHSFDWTDLAIATTAFGSPCRLGKIEVLLTDASSQPIGPFELLAKFALQPASLPGGKKLPLLVGLHFLEETGGKLVVDFGATPPSGSIEL